MAATRRLSQLVESASDRLVLPNLRPVVALSGGADSAALAYLVKEQGEDIRAIHVNHNLAYSGLMEKTARSIADQLDIALQVVSVAVPEGASPEGQARKARYGAFGGIPDSDAVLTAHTLDDNAETMLINLIRGTGVRGLTGIPTHRPPNIFRPILRVRRSETREIAALVGLPFVDDPMNEDLSLTRNLLRAQVYPVLRQLNPQLSEAMARTAEALAADADYLDHLSPTPTLHEGRASISLGVLAAASRPLMFRTLLAMIGHVVGEGSLSAARLDRVWGVARGESTAQQIGRGAVARRNGPNLIIEIENNSSPSVSIQLTPGRHLHGGVAYEVAEIDSVCRVVPLSKWAAIFPLGTALGVGPDGVVHADGESAWVPGERRLPVAWYTPGSVGYLSVFAIEERGWTSSP